MAKEIYTDYTCTDEQMVTQHELAEFGFRQYKVMGDSMTMVNKERDLAIVQRDGSYTIREDR